MKTIKNLLLSFLLACTLLSACKEKEETPPKETHSLDPRDRFVGTYRVTDDTGVVYTMTISKFNSSSGVRYLSISNYANMFDIPSENFNHNLNPDSIPYNGNNLFVLAPRGPIKDKNNITWDITTGGNDSATVYEENYLYGNAIVLYFRLSNMPYYGMDKVPYHRQFHTHIATKIN